MVCSNFVNFILGGIIAFIKNYRAFYSFLKFGGLKYDLHKFHIIGIVLAFILGIIFTGISGRIVGIVGSSSNYCFYYC